MVSNGGNVSGDDTVELAAGSVAEDQHSVADAFFVDPGAINFRLLAESPAINAGVEANAPLTDIEGNPRIGQIDAGAYEFDPSTSISTLLLDNSALAILPNPVDDQLRFELSNEYVGEINFRIYSANGQLINNWTVNKNIPVLNETLSVKGLAAGSYRLFAISNEGIVNQQFVKL